MLRSEDSRGYRNEFTIYYNYGATRNQYTYERLTLGVVYNISVRARIRPISGCYSYIYGEYSDSIFVETVETGNLISAHSVGTFSFMVRQLLSSSNFQLRVTKSRLIVCDSTVVPMANELYT